MPPGPGDPRARRARALAQAGDWPAAAQAFHDLAQALLPTEPQAAVQAWSLAADAWRRDDRPAPAATALREALRLLAEVPGRALPAEVSGRALLEVQLAGVLAEAGQVLPGRDLALSARDRAANEGEQSLAADLLAGLHLELGELDAAEQAAASLGVPAARHFRLATCFRVRGRLDLALDHLDRARALVPSGAALAGLRAALAHEAGELALQAEDPDEALAAFLVAQAEWSAARRRSGLFRAAGGEVRAQLARGQTPLARALTVALDYAVERGLPLLEADLRLARGAARARAALAGAEDDLDRAVALAEAVGAGLLEGRARMARRAAGVQRADDARAMARLLAGTAWG